MEDLPEILDLLIDEKIRLLNELEKVNLAIKAYIPVVFNTESTTGEKINFALSVLKCASLIEIVNFLYKYELDNAIEIEYLTFKVKNTLFTLKKKKAVLAVYQSNSKKYVINNDPAISLC